MTKKHRCRRVGALLNVPLLFGVVACGGDWSGGSSGVEEAVDICLPDADGWVRLSDVAEALGCDFSTDVKTVFIHDYITAQMNDYVPPDTTGMDERTIRVAEVDARASALDSSTRVEWKEGLDDRCLVLGGNVVMVPAIGGQTIDTYSCVVNDRDVPTLDAWQPECPSDNPLCQVVDPQD